MLHSYIIPHIMPHNATWYYMILHDTTKSLVLAHNACAETAKTCKNNRTSNIQKQLSFVQMNYIYKFTSSKWINPKAIIIPSQTRAFLFTCLLPAWVFSISLFKRKKSSLVCKCRYKGTSYDVTLLKAVKLDISVHNCVECRQPAIACLILTCSCRCSRPDWPDLWTFF